MVFKVALKIEPAAILAEFAEWFFLPFQLADHETILTYFLFYFANSTRKVINTLLSLNG